MAYTIDGVGPTVVRTFTFPDANATMLTTNAAVTAAQGGTGIASYAVGDLLYASGATAFSRLAAVAAGAYLRAGGVVTAPLWSTLLLPNSATAGDLVVATAANTWGAVADVAVGQVLTSGGVGVVPAFSATPTLTSLTLSGLTATRVPFAGVAGLLGDITGFTFASGVLTIPTAVAIGTNPASAGSGQVRIPYQGVLAVRNQAGDDDMRLIGSAGFAINDVTIGTFTITTGVVLATAGVTSFGGASALFPGLRRDTIFLQFKLADDSGVSGAVTASLPVADAARNGIIAFDTTLNALVYYVGGGRYKLVGTSF